jgi:catechol 2,3-dioxygenase-like lactoylglutathione lyase family enzyme
MRVVAALSQSAPEPAHRSLVSPPKSVASATSVLLLAFAAGSSDVPVGSLRLSADPGLPFAAHATSLRLPDHDRVDIANELLWYATRHEKPLRSGAALLAQPAASKDRSELERLGFTTVEPSSDDSNDGDAAPLALARRRNPAEPPSDASHAALFVSDIRRSLDFWSLLHFEPTRLFTTEGARAAWLSAPWTSLSLELIEVPSVVLRSQTCGGSGGGSSDDGSGDEAGTAIGLAHVCVDVTPLGIGMPSTLEVLRERSRQRFGRDLTVVTEPHQQMMADLVAEVAVVRAPDGVLLELVHRAGILSMPMTPDWSLEK